MKMIIIIIKILTIIIDLLNQSPVSKCSEDCTCASLHVLIFSHLVNSVLYAKYLTVEVLTSTCDHMQTSELLWIQDYKQLIIITYYIFTPPILLFQRCMQNTWRWKCCPGVRPKSCASAWRRFCRAPGSTYTSPV